MRVTITEYTGDGPVRWGSYAASEKGTHELVCSEWYWKEWPDGTIACRTTFESRATMFLSGVHGHWHKEAGGDYLLIPIDDAGRSLACCRTCAGDGTIGVDADECPDCHGTGRQG